MIRYFVKHPTAANLVMAAFILLGILNINNIERETFPEFSLNYISATVVYPGASPLEAEQSLCLRMEDAVDSLSGIAEVRCEASEGLATLIVKLDDATDVSRMLVDVQTEINAINDFPVEIEAPIVQQLEMNEAVLDIAVSADTDWPDLKAYAEDLKRRMKLDAGVSLVEVSGFSDHELRVEVREVALRRMGLSINAVAEALAAQNLMLPSGNIEMADRNLLIRFDERRVTAATLGELVISSSAEGGVVRLRDVATITDRFEQDEAKVLFNDQNSAIVKISKSKTDDALEVKARVMAFLEQERLRAPDGITITASNDTTSLLWDRLTMMVRNGGQGIVLVFAVMWLFFSLRYSFWVALGLPVSFLGGLYAMFLLGISINIMSLVALLMAIGILMDDAIVIAESIGAQIDNGEDLDGAVIHGVSRVMPGVISSFLTTVCVFGSLMFLDGQMGAVLSTVPKVLLLVLAISLIEAFLVLPAHLAHSLHSARKRGVDAGKVSRFKAGFQRRFEFFRSRILKRWVRTAVNYRYITLGLTMTLLLGSLGLVSGGAVKFIPFPELDGDIVEARVILPPGSTLAQTETVVAQISAAAKRVTANFSELNEGDEPLLENITEHFNSNQDAGEVGPHVATVRLDLRSAEIRATQMDDVVAAWREQTGAVTEAVALSFSQPTMGPAGRDIEVRLKGDDLDQIKLASVAMQNYLTQFSGVTDLLDDMRPGKEEVLVTLLPGAESYGINGQMIASQLRAAYFGQTADEIQVGPENLQINVLLDKADAAQMRTLERFPIVLASGDQVPLSSVARLNFQRGFVRIQRVDGLRTVTVTGNVDNRYANATEVVNQLKAEFAPQLLRDFPSVRLDFEGQTKETADTGSSMGQGFLIGIFGVFAILSLQFRSYSQPFVVMLAIPFALIGVIWGHLLLGYSLSMPSIMGFVSLAGIVVNNSILLMQYIREHITNGQAVIDAVVAASGERFRAVMITSMTTAAGMLPLLTETSLQAQVVQPLVVSIVFGLFSSTLLVVLVLPCAYTVLDDLGWVSHDQHH
ncbi:efflux RND transporter permease subunit [Ferrimonas lipolytica]|uniref:Efflux RND transporter permease subunit n=1 Tax=Ferrimonas lipolytica TaxID=2724191 RepID=A0A6H1UAS4_9GAMM|nr:efflux RND transporter permease subunit [Ferrimonas lipolytica]QIZ75729.1 efflux RND transporter permease subunit [Ferrimonas lipolytica]